jgi:hypothetical protein
LTRQWWCVWISPYCCMLSGTATNTNFTLWWLYSSSNQHSTTLKVSMLTLTPWMQLNEFWNFSQSESNIELGDMLNFSMKCISQILLRTMFVLPHMNYHADLKVTFNDISVITWQPFLFVEEIRIPRKFTIYSFKHPHSKKIRIPNLIISINSIRRKLVITTIMKM